MEVLEATPVKLAVRWDLEPAEATAESVLQEAEAAVESFYEALDGLHQRVRSRAGISAEAFQKLADASGFEERIQGIERRAMFALAHLQARVEPAAARAPVFIAMPEPSADAASAKHARAPGTDAEMPVVPDAVSSDAATFSQAPEAQVPHASIAPHERRKAFVDRMAEVKSPDEAAAFIEAYAENGKYPLPTGGYASAAALAAAFRAIEKGSDAALRLPDWALASAAQTLIADFAQERKAALVAAATPSASVLRRIDNTNALCDALRVFTRAASLMGARRGEYLQVVGAARAWAQSVARIEARTEDPRRIAGMRAPVVPQWMPHARELAAAFERVAAATASRILETPHFRKQAARLNAHADPAARAYVQAQSIGLRRQTVFA